MNWSIPKGGSWQTLAPSFCTEVQVVVSEVSQPLATEINLSDGPRKGKSSINTWRENASCSEQQKPVKTEREPCVETERVWVLGSSPEGICNHLYSLTVSFFFFFLNFHSVDRCTLRVRLLSSQRPCVALHPQSAKPRPLHCACVPITWIGCLRKQDGLREMRRCGVMAGII